MRFVHLITGVVVQMLALDADLALVSTFLIMSMFSNSEYIREESPCQRY